MSEKRAHFILLCFFYRQDITVWIDILAGRIGAEDCCLSMVDSTTSSGWAYKTNFKEEGEDPIEAAV
eukprot:scaffold7500_cov75-Skeletonema_dohrnii-CCMP3373.AAC.4